MKLIAITTIITLIFNFCANSQLKHTSHFYKKANLFCGESIILDSTGLFFRGEGCEGDQFVTLGRYSITKDGRLSVDFLPFDSISPINQILKAGKTNDSLVKILLFDREQKPVFSSFRIVLIDTSGMSETLWLDREGEVLINRFRYKILILDQLASIYKEVEPILINENSLEIYFNLPAMFLMYSRTSIGEPEKLNLVVKKDGLYESSGKRKIYKIIN